MINLTITSPAGLILVAAGIIFVAVQLLRKNSRPPESRNIDAGLGPFKFALKTPFPGLLVIGLGAISITVAAVTGR